MKRKTKPATAGEKIAGDMYPEGTIDHAICRMKLSRRIDRAIARAVRKERERCAVLAEAAARHLITLDTMLDRIEVGEP